MNKGKKQISKAREVNMKVEKEIMTDAKRSKKRRKEEKRKRAEHDNLDELESVYIKKLTKRLKMTDGSSKDDKEFDSVIIN